MVEKSMAAVLERAGEIIIKEFPVPEIGPEDGLLKVEMVRVQADEILRPGGGPRRGNDRQRRGPGRGRDRRGGERRSGERPQENA